ncbi:CLUMA_CG006870, isoform A [Clunio marinus]|uniref:CLUMA_CG006870, isoform A n=1 Tax=Clunio marinus TaxID=568069 RepID=A0A1J1I4L9_9DIPT|nr:CLUMA_CG006870, isoform A [Clunio marinus]
MRKIIKLCLILILFLTSSCECVKDEDCDCKESKIDPIDCMSLRNKIQICTGSFLEHAIMNNNPYAICTNNCTYESHRLTLKYYERLFIVHDNHTRNSLCADALLRQNRMNVIDSVVSYVKSIWESSNCDNCYNEATGFKHNFSRKTEEFFDFQDKYKECINTEYKNGSNNSVTCNNCQKYYQIVNSFYEQIRESSENKICFDIEDKMDKIRFDWTENHKCHVDKNASYFLFYSLAGLIVGIAITFFGVVYHFGLRKRSENPLDDEEVSQNDETLERLFEGSSEISNEELPVESSTPIEKRDIESVNSKCVDENDTDDDDLPLSGDVTVPKLISFN